MPRKSPIKNASPKVDPGFISYDKNDSKAFQKAVAQSTSDLINFQQSQASSLREFSNIDTNISVRDGFTRLDYEYFRPEERTPQLQREIIAACMEAYRKVGIIKSVIDLMGDFGARGVRIVHPDKSTQAVYQTWFRRVRGKERSERFLNMLYQAGNVVVKRNTAKIDAKHIRRLKRTQGADIKKLDKPEIPRNEIPDQYWFPNPLTVEVVMDEVAALANHKIYGLSLPLNIIQRIQSPKNDYERQIVQNIPADIYNAVINNQYLDTLNFKVIPFDPAKILVFHYKKNDWNIWADPMIYCIIDDIIMLRKLRLADLSALDGAIQNIRIWILGDLEKGIMPSEAAYSKLNNILTSTPTGGVLNLIWNPAIDLKETSTEIAKFLGSEKYQVTLSNIYQALGIPRTLRGTGETGGMVDNFIELKTMVERLQYGRDTLNEFWDGELEIVRKALSGIPGFQSKKRAKVIYDHINLADASSLASLIRDMVDRDIISKETARHDLGYDHDIEESRIDDEYPKRKRQPKLGPFPDGNPELTLKKLFVQRGQVTPSEVGLILDEKNPKEKSAIDVQLKGINSKNAQIKDKIGVSGQGRPKTSKDKSPRKKRQPLKASDGMEIFTWTRQARAIIAEFLQPIVLTKYNKKNIRSLSNMENNSFEELCFATLSNIEPLTEINPIVIGEALKTPFDIFDDCKRVCNNYIDKIISNNQIPTLEDKRILECLSYMEAHNYVDIPI